jgi:digeranylgeranylglycerophospholipid reductase
VVVGAGPAGLVAARTVASSGYSVVVLERERRLGVKPCGEACSRATLMDSMVDPEGDFVVREIAGARVYAPNGSSVSIQGDAGVGCILDKALYLEHLASKAAEAGADIRVGCAVESINRNDSSPGRADGDAILRVGVRPGAGAGNGIEDGLEASVMIGADGFNSTVARSFGLEESGKRELIPCVQYHMVNCDFAEEGVAEFYLGKNVAPMGYAWAFPKGGGRANVGVGVRGAPAKPYLDRFIDAHPTMFGRAGVVGLEAAPVTVGGLLRKIVADGVVLVGEAAGQVVPLTGAGIHSGVAGAQMAGLVVSDALAEGDVSAAVLERYQRDYAARWGRRIGDSLKALRAVERLSDEDLNELAGLLSQDDVLDLANGLDITRVAAKLIRHPLLGLRLARALM